MEDSHLWRIQNGPSEEAISVIQARDDDGLDSDACTGREKG